MASELVKVKMFEVQKDIHELTREVHIHEEELEKTAYKAKEIGKMIEKYQHTSARSRRRSTRRESEYVRQKETEDEPEIFDTEPFTTKPLLSVEKDFADYAESEFSIDSSDSLSQCSGQTSDSEIDLDTKFASRAKTYTITNRFYEREKEIEREEKPMFRETKTYVGGGISRSSRADRFKVRKRSEHDIKIL